MKRILGLLLCGLLVTSLGACSKNEQRVVQGAGRGFGGEIKVEVTLEGDKIVKVTATGENETEGIGTKALEELPVAIQEKGSLEVDMVTGATITSEGIIYAINNALDPEAYPYGIEEKEEEKEPEEVVASDLYQGIAMFSTGRLGPGSDDQGVGVYSFNEVFANVLFDGEGKIVDIFVDQLEVATPNYDGASMPHFSGFPTQSYNNDENHDAKVDGVLEVTEDSFMNEVASWQSKRERGDGYVMGTGTWEKQMDKFQEVFVGKTVEEVKDWFTKYTSDNNGRPLKADASDEKDKAKYDALSDDEKAMLADVTTAATMSLNDAHGNIIAAIEKAYENRRPLAIETASARGFGLSNLGRLGPGSDDQGVGVYSFNQVFADVLFDDAGKVVAINVDQLEVATPNYDGASMPHFSGFPTQSYNNDENHDAKVDGVLEVTEDSFMNEVASWQSKRERGDGYVMGTGTWEKQMNKFEEIFVGKTVAEIEEWFAKYTSDNNGRPLKADASDEKDKAKYDALSDDEKAMLADVTTAATMSLNDGHGNILDAIKKAYENREEVKISVE